MWGDRQGEMCGVTDIGGGGDDMRTRKDGSSM